MTRSLTLMLILLLGSVFAIEKPAAAQKPKPTEAEEAATKQPTGKPYVAGRHKPTEATEDVGTQSTSGRKQVMDVTSMDCDTCHVCESPTKQSPCLRMCPRSVAEVIAETAHEQLPEDVILLDAFDWEGRRFMPVPFNHKVHADMAGMAGGCEICHHHSAKGKLHPACKMCHNPAPANTGIEEMRMPSLKGAYHRQCMGCHRDWAHNTKCGICHLPKGKQPKPSDVVETLALGDIAGAHPLIENPEHILHETEYEPGPNVMFRHKEHIDLYGYECVRCHRGENCARCHEQIHKPREQLDVVKRETHGACFGCHAEDRCERCHSKEKHPEPQRFNHSLTGFPLEKYHGGLTCRACHKRLFFLRKLESECSFCHKDWDPDTFDHAVTGQVLDENHTDIDCRDCHKDAKFIGPPSCDECHDEDVGFPARRPGPTVTPKTSAND